MSTEGVASPDASADFDSCLELAAADPKGDDMFSTLKSVWAYYLSRGEIPRARQISERQRPVPGDGRDYFRPQNLAGLGMLDWFAGRFEDAAAQLTEAIDRQGRLGRQDEVAAVWFVPNDHTTSMHTHLAVARFMLGDLDGAQQSIERARALAAALEFPQGPWSAGYTMWLGSWVQMEAGGLERAAETLAELRSSSARHGFDNWELVATTHTAALEAITALHARLPAAGLLEHAGALINHVDLWEMLGLRVFLPFYITTAGTLLAAAGDADGARQRYEESLALASETGMRFYDAETTRRRAHLAPMPDATIDELHAALDLARTQ